MKIYGYQKTTLLDYPEHVAATIFTGGCNFRCPFCQNAGLVNLGKADSAYESFHGGNGQHASWDGSEKQSAQDRDRQHAFRNEIGQQPLRDMDEWHVNHGMSVISEEEVLAHLKKRQGILDGVCITGGEPTLQPDLEEFIRKIRDLGYKVKLDSNGYRPEVLRRLLEQGLLDYVAMDVKASRENYARTVGLERIGAKMEQGAVGLGQNITEPGKYAVKLKQSTAGLEFFTADLEGQCDGGRFHLERIEESIAILMDSGIPYEFRTTAVKGLHTVEEFEEIGRWLAGSRAYFIQSYRDDGEILNGAGLCSFEVEELRQMQVLAGKYIARVELRGVE